MGEGSTTNGKESAEIPRTKVEVGPKDLDAFNSGGSDTLHSRKLKGLRCKITSLFARIFNTYIKLDIAPER